MDEMTRWILALLDAIWGQGSGIQIPEAILLVLQSILW